MCFGILFFFWHFFSWLNLTGKTEDTLETHTFDFQTLEKSKPPLGFPLSERCQYCWSGAIRMYKPSGVNALLHPKRNPSPSKQLEALKGKGEKKVAKCQHVLWHLLYCDAGFAFCRSDISGAKSVKSQQVLFLSLCFQSLRTTYKNT